MRLPHTRTVRALAGATLLASSLGACDFVESPTGDPNAVPVASLDQLFTAAQVNSYFFTEGELSRLASMWIKQLFGADRQFATQYEYIINESTGEDAWFNTYRSGGLVDLQAAQALAAEADLPVYRGILQIHEAYLIGMAAATWGDIPYSEAGDPAIPNPALDPQLEVYDRVQQLLDEAIANLETGRGRPAPGVDLNFDGDADSWLEVAHSLKARFYMHVAEVEGQSAYQSALQQAQMGISSIANNWMAIHTTTATENNVWYQFQRDRSGYIEPNPYFVNLLGQAGDPRLELYFDTPVLNDQGSWEANEIGLPATQDFDQPMVSCAETQFILAEAALQLGQVTTARQALAAGIECEEDFWNVDIDYVDPTTVPQAELLETIITQKYIALFLNPEIWSDYRRTCLPDIVPVAEIAGELQVPPGLFYPLQERQTNPNVPAPNPGTLRNPNNPNGCPLP